ncbi:ABC transporter permease [Rhizobium sp. SSA_523]|uniref:ABC transporter permease n=1 Tax=Rhizobium sp. SSA_523 TaxID=2952477 RepID=UPI002090433C|nr:ABC transporter permease [Rhizobium sp. SSA_523]MCO5732515.1 ABC transporter permease [Rhizobium sp. SSA_523]WKC22345.1 ABC transporter permease [Rhizobium sp. SSA_523]
MANPTHKALTAEPIRRIDKLGAILLPIILLGLFAEPFALSRANRIVAAQPVLLFDALPAWQAGGAMAGIVLAGLMLILPTRTTLRLSLASLAIAVLTLLLGQAAANLLPEANRYARVSPGGGYWLMLFGFSIALADSIARLRLGPGRRIGLLAVALLALAALLASGIWDSVSILKEYDIRRAAFWRELRTHLLLAGGSLCAAAIVGIPLGILCFRAPRLRAVILNSLNIVQTIPSIALFGLLIAPLAWIGRSVPGANAIGIAGIGIAPAFVALFGYSLLPMVANTVAGLETVSRDARDAARGMGMTVPQRLWQIEVPLAFPVILTGIRIVLVQNIGMAVIAGLIGGGGLGTFVFQGISQTATDLVLLGALPVVGMAFAAAIILDALVEMSARGSVKGHAT